MAQTGERGAQARMPAWVRNLGEALGRPILAVVLAIIAGAIVILITCPNTAFLSIQVRIKFAQIKEQ